MHLLERAHLANLAQLVAEILEREFAAAQLAFELGDLLGVHGLLDALDQREHVAHAQDARDDALGIKRVQRVVFFARAHEFHRRSRHFADGKRRAAARVAVELGQDDAGQAEPLVKFAGGADRVLPDHGVRHEQDFRRRKLALQRAQLFHQRVVNVQAAGGVHEDHVVRGKLGFANRAAHDFERLVGARAGPARNVDGLGHLRKLFARRGAVDVGRDHDRPVPVRGEPLREFAGGGGFAGALQADDHPHRRRARGEQRLGVLAEQQRQLVAHNLDDLLVGRKLQQHFGAEGFFANVREQFVDHADVDVAFEQRFADAVERFVHVLLREFSLAAQVLENALQLVCQVLKHEDLSLEIESLF